MEFLHSFTFRGVGDGKNKMANKYGYCMLQHLRHQMVKAGVLEDMDMEETVQVAGN